MAQGKLQFGVTGNIWNLPYEKRISLAKEEDSRVLG